MKKIFTFILILPLLSHGQKMNISYFSIGELTVDSLEAKSGLMMVKSQDKTIPREAFKKWHNNKSLISMKDSMIFEITQADTTKPYKYFMGKVDDGDEMIYRSQFINGYRIFEKNELIINGISFKEVKLIFLNDTLISFECNDNSKIGDIMKYKYGEPEVTNHKDTINCTFTYTGNKVTYEQYDITQKWELAQYTARLYNSKFYSSDCKPLFIYTFNMFDKDKLEEYNSKTKHKMDSYRDKIKEIKSSDMSKF